MAHKWVYLGNYSYQCQNCGLQISRDEMKARKLPGCRLEAETRLEQLEISVMAKFDAIEKRLKLVEGGVIK